jgi:hypothetical protein
MGLVERLSGLVSPVVEGNMMVFNLEHGTVKVNETETRIIFTNGDDTVCWVNESDATDDDIENMKSWGNTSYNSFNVSPTNDSLAYDDIMIRVEHAISGGEYPENFVVTVDLPDDVIEYFNKLSAETGKPFQEVLEETITESLTQMIKKEESNNGSTVTS